MSLKQISITNCNLELNELVYLAAMPLEEASFDSNQFSKAQGREFVKNHFIQHKLENQEVENEELFKFMKVKNNFELWESLNKGSAQKEFK